MRSSIILSFEKPLHCLCVSSLSSLFADSVFADLLIHYTSCPPNQHAWCFHGHSWTRTEWRKPELPDTRFQLRPKETTPPSCSSPHAANMHPFCLLSVTICVTIFPICVLSVGDSAVVNGSQAWCWSAVWCPKCRELWGALRRRRVLEAVPFPRISNIDVFNQKCT